MDFKNFFVMAAIVITPAVYAQDIETEVETEETDTIVWSQEGFESAHSAIDAMNDVAGMRYDVEYFSDGSIEGVYRRGGLYLSPRVGFEYNYLFTSKTNYPSFVGEIGLGYRTKRVDARVYAGIATCRYGNLSDKNLKYLSPRVSVEVLGEVAHDRKFEENLFKIGGAINYKLRRTYIEDEACQFSFTGSYPGIALILEYERQFFGSRSSLAITATVGTDCEIGNGTKAWGIAGNVSVAYRIGVQKKTVWKADMNAL